MTKIAYITNAPAESGMGKPAREIFRHMPTGMAIDKYFLDVTKLATLPGPFKAKPVQWWRLSRQLPRSGYDLWHLTNQSLSFIPCQPVVVTVYDLIELLDPQQRFGKTVARYLYRGIPRADHIICISSYTRKTIQDNYHIPDNKITVIPLAAGSAFKRIPNAKQSIEYHQFLKKYHLTPDHKIILYVGSDHPRKNLGTLAAVFAEVRETHPNTILIKVGDPGLASGRAVFLSNLDRLDLRNHTRLINNRTDEELAFLYSIADVFVFPSTFEGFGLPPLEAMACGCPVVVSNATSLPEVVGDAGLLHVPQDIDAFTASIRRIFDQPKLARDLSQRGKLRAAQFTWQHIADQTNQVYQHVI